MRTRIISFVIVLQTLLLLLHAFVYWTWIFFARFPRTPRVPCLEVAFLILAFSFISASLLAWRFRQWPVRIYYTTAAVWVGLFNFLVLASIACWILLGLVRALHLNWPAPDIAASVFGAALVVGIYGLWNASLTRVRRATVKLANLPAPWRGRIAALVSDTHLGHVRGARFARRIVQRIASYRPDLVLIAGDFYDGTAADLRKFAAPLSSLSPPHGTYYIAGNHEQFGDDRKYLEAVSAAGVRVLNNEKVILDGLQIIGVHFRDAARPDRLRAILQQATLDPQAASILLTHAPSHLGVVLEAGISLQVNGHTHGGQFFPWTIPTRRIYGQFVYGLHRLGNLQVYTSCGAGTWGPPLRVGTTPEIVLLRFE